MKSDGRRYQELFVLDLVVCNFFEHRGMEREVTSRKRDHS
jgi:hypothetical protein